jgi:hypothetical protein
MTVTGAPPHVSALEELALDMLVLDELVLEELALDMLVLEELVLEELVLEELVLEELALDELVLEELALDELVLEELALDELVLEELALDMLALDEEPALDELALKELALDMLDVFVVDRDALVDDRTLADPLTDMLGDPVAVDDELTIDDPGPALEDELAPHVPATPLQVVVVPADPHPTIVAAASARAELRARSPRVPQTKCTSGCLPAISFIGPCSSRSKSDSR